MSVRTQYHPIVETFHQNPKNANLMVALEEESGDHQSH